MLRAALGATRTRGVVPFGEAVESRSTPVYLSRPLPAGILHLTARQAEVLQLSVRGLSTKQVARHLGISVRTVEDHYSAMRQRAGAHNQSQLVAYAVAAGLVNPEPDVPETVISGTAVMPTRSDSESRPTRQPRNGVPPAQLRDKIRDDRVTSISAAFNNRVRIGYARLNPRGQDHQPQLSALADAQCREILVETARCSDARPELGRAVAMLRRGDTLVIYKLDLVARSFKELIVLLEERLRAGGINLHILSGTCAGLHRPDGAIMADKMLFMVAAMLAEMERNLLRERTLDGLHAVRGQHQGRRGRPAVVGDAILAIARARRERGESVTYIARDIGIGRSTLYRALDLQERQQCCVSTSEAPPLIV
jgi:DNA invertase Pin-like site-specific DNA recombinase/DNA-binding CsgD family transcriptional regulator